jgi:hypothetical protein
VGLYAGYGIGGKIKGEETSDYTGETETRTEKVNFLGESNLEKEEYTNRFDLGLTLGLTLQYSKFTFGLGYDYGFLKVDNKNDDDEFFLSKDGLSNRNFKVSVGYFF